MKAFHLLLLIACVSAEDSRFVSAEYRFQMSPPAIPAAEGIATQVAHFYLPATAGFAANVNVQAQPYSGTVKEYLDLSLDQMKQLQMEIVTAKMIGSSAVIEYRGTMQNLSLHFYAMAVKPKDKILLITGTTLDERWKLDGAAIKKSVDSFKLLAK